MNTDPEHLNYIRGLRPHLESRIIGQNHVIPKVADVLEAGELGLHPDNRPKGSFLFLGPTGVGKTETVLAFTEYLSKQTLFRFDMSEFQHQDGIKLLAGSESGHQGRLTQVLSKHKSGVLLFDEMEKAHRLILDLFLQILEPGRFTDAQGITYDVRNWYLVFTSNIGGADVMRHTNLPMATIERFVFDKLNQELRPEFANRFSQRIVFSKLSYDAQRRIALICLDSELKKLAEKGCKLTASPEAIEFLIRNGIHKHYGARPMRNTVERHLANAVRTALLSGQPSSGILTVNPETKTLIITS